MIVAHIIDLSHAPQLSFLRPFFDAYISVTCFFIISGYLISKSFIQTRNYKSYFLKRVRRLIPAYAFVVIISAISLSLISCLSAHQYFFNTQLFKYLFANLSFVNFIQPCLPGVFTNNHMCAVNGALWTIKIEVCFYIILPLLIILLSKLQRKYYLLVLLYLIGLAYKFLMVHYLNRTGNVFFNTLSNQLPAFLPYFSCGIALHYYFDTYIKHSKMLFFLAIPVFLVEHYYGLEVLKPLALSAMLFYIAFNFKVFNNFGKHGDISYGIYIFHFPIIQLFVNYHIFEDFNPWLSAGVIILIVIALGFLSWNFLEKRFLSRKTLHRYGGTTSVSFF